MPSRPGPGRLAALALVLVVACGLALPALRAPAAHLPPERGSGGAVVSGHEAATAAGIQVLRDGGNAADAAVATALMLAVVFPEAGNLGGGGFAVVRMGDDVAALDFREVAPAAATRDMYLDADGKPLLTEPPAKKRSLVGPLAAGVPGSPAGLHELHRRFGALPWERVVQPAIRAAYEGFPVDEHLHDLLEQRRELLERFPETAATWLPDGAPPPVGSLLRLRGLALTLGAYADEGPAAVTGGRVAEEIESLSRRHGGVLTAADLAAYEPQWRSPVRFVAYGWNVASMPLPSSGGLILGEVTGMLERLGWSGEPRGGARRAHLLTESFRRAFADRFVMGDPTTSRVTSEDLLAPRWLQRRAGEVDRAKASDSRRVEVWPGKVPELPAAAPEPADTTHLSVIDRDGNMVALTTTLNGLFGSGLFVPRLGFLNNEMDDFATAPGRPNDFGLIQGEANAVRPGKRMLSSMSPTLAWRDAPKPRPAKTPEDAPGDDPGAQLVAVALGGRGGSLIPTNTLQVLLNVLVDGDDLQAAVNRPRLHHQWLPDTLLAEPDALSPETRDALRGLGHQVEVKDRAAKVHAVGRTVDGRDVAARDPRGPGAAAVAAPPGAVTIPPQEVKKPK